jgi:hypothetical protein
VRSGTYCGDNVSASTARREGIAKILAQLEVPSEKGVVVLVMESYPHLCREIYALHVT